VSAEAAEQSAVEVPPPDLDRVARLVPTERQVREGGEYDVAALEAALRTPDDAVPQQSRGDRARAYVALINPANIEGPKLPLVMFGLSVFIAGWDAAALSVTGPEIQAEFGLSVAALATIASVTQNLATLLGLPLGYLVDRVKRVWIVRTTELLGAVGDVVQAAAPSFGVLTMGRVAAAPARLPGSSQVALYPLLSDYFPSRSRGRVFGFIAFMSTFGSLLAAPAVGFITRDFGWRQASLTVAVVAAVSTLLAFLLREPSRGGMERRELGVQGEALTEEPPPPSFSEAVRGAWAIKSVRLFAIAGAAQGFTASLGLVQSLVLASKFGLDPLQRSLLVTISSVVLLVALAAGSGVADRLLQKNPATMVSGQAGIAFLTAAAMVGEAFAPNLYLFVGLSLVPVIGLGLLLPAETTVLSMLVPPRFRGVGMKINTPFVLIVGLMAPAMLGLVDTTHLQLSLLVFAPFALVSGFIYLAAAGSVGADMRTARAAAVAAAESEESRRARQNKILVLRDVDVTIDEVQILFRVDLDIREGEVVALVGTNGAGKSTILRAICGLQPATNGAIFFDGKEVTYLAPHQTAHEGIVYMPGGQGVFPLMSVRDNLTTAAWMTRKGDEDANARIEEVLEFFPRLRERLDVLAGTMSGGEQQMLALGQAFLMKPRLLMIDELSLGLAPTIVEQLLEAIRGMKTQGITVILVEQSLNVALTIADRSVFMTKGEVVFDGPTGELLARPDLVRSIFMGGTGSGASLTGSRRTTQLDDAKPDLLSCAGLSIAYGGVQALNDVTLQVGSGEVVGIIGPNGAGKTTLFDLLSGYADPDSGSVVLDGVDITGLGPDARARLGLGRAFQNARLFPPLTVRENIAVAMEKRASRSPVLAALGTPAVRKAERKLMTRVDGFIELLGLTAYADKFVRELSTGTRRAVEVACQMAAEPKVLLLDEPSSGLAQAETEALGPALLRIVKETGCGILVIEHDLPLITSISDRLIAMELGRVVTTGTPQEVTTDPRVLASYLAASADVIERSGSRVGSVLSAISAPARA
jgi:branched-chain amino acid transport system ATP-binding protein